MGQFQYEWYTVDVKEATGRTTWGVKAKNKDGAIKQIEKMAKDHDDFVRTARPDFTTEIFWNTFALDHVGYKRLF